MKKQKRILLSAAVLLAVCGVIALGSLNAQQASSAPVVVAQAQEPQSGQQPAQAPGQDTPSQQPAQAPGQGSAGQQPGQQTPGQAAPPDQQAPGQATSPDQQQQPAQPAPGSATGQQQGVQTFTGMIVKSGDKFVLQDQATGNTYDVDHQDIVSQHAGRRVRLTGTLDPSGKMIHLQQPSGQ